MTESSLVVFKVQGPVRSPARKTPKGLCKTITSALRNSKDRKDPDMQRAGETPSADPRWGKCSRARSDWTGHSEKGE